MPTADPNVTAILLCYNSENYVAQALGSALSQDCAPMQLIVSDDASTDGTTEVVREMLATYRGPHRVEFYQRTENSGTKSAHLNDCFRRANGEVIVSFDDDDISQTYRVRRIVDAFVANPRAQAVFSSFSIIDETGQPRGRGTVPHPAAGSDVLRWFARIDAYAAGTTLAIRREVVEQFGELDPDIHEDIVLPFRASLLGDVIYLDEDLVQARRHGASQTRDFDDFASLERYRKRIVAGIERARRRRASRYADIQTAAALMPERAAELCALHAIVLDSIAQAESTAGLVSGSVIKRLVALINVWRTGAYREERLRHTLLALVPRCYLWYKRASLRPRRTLRGTTRGR
jgi:glycosyltransferase involved in cell wall biosynthesis